MDKGKNRTDLLAAGRKKLQQFRQKKEHKGGGSKASNEQSAKSRRVKVNHQDQESNTVVESKEVNGVATTSLATSVTDADSDGSQEVQIEPNIDDGTQKAEIEGEDHGSGTELEVDGVACSIQGRNLIGVSDDFVPSMEHEISGSVDSSHATTEESIKEALSVEDDVTKEKVQGHSFGEHSISLADGVASFTEGRYLVGVSDDSVTGPSVKQERSGNVDNLGAPTKEDHEGGDTSSSSCLQEKDTATVTSVKKSHGDAEDDEELTSSTKRLEREGESSNPSNFECQMGQKADDTSALAEDSSSRDDVILDGYAHDLVHHSTDANTLDEVNDVAESETKQTDEFVAYGHEKSFKPSSLGDFCVSNDLEDDASEDKVLGQSFDGHSISLAEATMYKGEICHLGNSSDVAKETNDMLGEDFADGLESIKRHMYLTYIGKEILQLQLVEQAEMEEMVSELQESMVVANEPKAALNEELAHCMSELQAIARDKKAVEITCLSVKEDSDKLHDRIADLQRKQDLSQEEVVHLSIELANWQTMVETLHKENKNLTAHLILEEDSRKKHEVEKEFLTRENRRLAAEFSEQNEKLIAAYDKHVQLEAMLREIDSSMDQLTEENLSLSSSLAVYKVMLEEHVTTCSMFPTQAYNTEDSANKPDLEHIASCDLVTTVVVTRADDDSDKSLILRILKERLQEAESMLQNLEKSIQDMLSYSLSSSRLGGRGVGVSKLIQAFETKVHCDDNVLDNASLDEGEKSVYPFALTKEQIGTLRAILAEVASGVSKVETDHIDARNIRRCVRELEQEYETKRHHVDLKQERIEQVVAKISEFAAAIENQQNLLSDIQKNTGDETERFSGLLELLQSALVNAYSMYKQENACFEAAIFEAIQKLDASTGCFISSELDISSHVNVSVDAAINTIGKLEENLQASCANHDAVQTSYEEVNKSFQELEGKYDLAFALLNNIHTNLKELTHDPSQNTGEAVNHQIAEGQLLQPESYETQIADLRNLLIERFHLITTVGDLKSKSMGQKEEVEKLHERCISLGKECEEVTCVKNELESILKKKCVEIEEIRDRCFALLRKFEEHEADQDPNMIGLPGSIEHNLQFYNVHNDMFDSAFSRLEAMTMLLLGKYDQAIKQMGLSRNYLQEVNSILGISADKWSSPLPALIREDLVPKVKEVDDLKEKLHSLSSANIQLDDEVKLLKERLSKLKEALEVSRSEVQIKVSELEQSEERLSSVREKLSIAVAKGKGLVAQRDSLKQSLLEKSNEVEKCEKELLAKEALLHEFEEKLKSCSEVGRIEALESELSYIRNSATALRDSFLLKDSILQRIEEVLEDLDLPDDFHSKDIVEKIELLSRMSAGNSSIIPPDLDQRVTTRYTESGVHPVAIDAGKNDIQHGKNTDTDDLKGKYEELNRKLYSLAEHNDMLEQSLTERNSLVQKWEEILDGIDMPPQMRVLEPDEKLEWLGRALPEVQRQKVSLQRKTEDLESSSNMLIVDLEESHKKISELTKEVVAMKSENEFLSQSLDELRFEYLNLSEKSVQDELDRVNLRRELADLHEKLVQRIDVQDFSDQLQKLAHMVITALPESERPEDVSSGISLEYLEGLLRALIDRCAVPQSAHKVADKEVIIEENNFPCDGKTHKDVEDNYDKMDLRSKLDHALHDLILVNEEKDMALQRCQSLMLEVESVDKQRNLLQEERTAEIEQSQLLVSELETIRREKFALQEELAQEKQKSASAREKLNVAVRKGKALVQQRDSLKSSFEELTTMVDQLKTEHQQKLESLVSEKTSLMIKLAEREKSLQQSNQSLINVLTALHDITGNFEGSATDPMQVVERITKLVTDLQFALMSSENEVKKSKQTVELLLAELNEVQERVDVLQEELLECSKQRDDAEVAKTDVLSRLEQVMMVHSQVKKQHAEGLVDLNSAMNELMKECSVSSRQVVRTLAKSINLIYNAEMLAESVLKDMDGESKPDISIVQSENPFSGALISKEKYGSLSNLAVEEPFDDGVQAENLDLLCFRLHEFVKEFKELKENIHRSSNSIDQQAECLSNDLGAIKRKLAAEKALSESLKRTAAGLEAVINEKDDEISVMRRSLSLLCEACGTAISEMKSRSSFSAGEHVSDITGMVSKLHGYGPEQESGEDKLSYLENDITVLTGTLLSTLRGLKNLDETAESNQNELRTIISELQRELQEKDLEKNRTCAELVSQIKEANSLANRYFTDLNAANSEIHCLQKQVAILDNDKKLLESKLDELKMYEASSKELHEKIESLTHAITAKDQEIEGLMQALDEEESQMESLVGRIKELENAIKDKNLVLESLEVSKAKAVAKLSATVAKFDELHDLSESLLAEVENLQSQLQERDSEISFLRHEVTRSTNDVLAAQESNQKSSSVVKDVLTRMHTMISNFGVHQLPFDGDVGSKIIAYSDLLEKNLESIMVELEHLRVSSQNKDLLLQSERDRVEELLHKAEGLETSLHEKEKQFALVQEGRTSGHVGGISSPGPLDIEQTRKKVSSPSIAPHVRGGRKGNGDQIAIAIDTEEGGNILDDEDDDKAHGFKSLTMSRIIPRTARPITDRIDAIWVSGDRLLMRQPTLRLGVIIYWILLHALLATSI